MMEAQHETSAEPDQPVARDPPNATKLLASETARLYASGWAAFVAWCRVARVAPLPAEPRTVAAYLATLGHLRAHPKITASIGGVFVAVMRAGWIV